MNNKEYSPEEYERALENVRLEWGTSDRDIDILQELVDRATPIKPIKSEEQDIRYVTKYECPNCHQYFTGRISKYCYHCGQALDWGEE